MTEIHPINYGNTLYIAKRMRALDREEIFATRWNDSEESLCEEAVAVPGMSFIASKNGEPVAAGGAVPMHPNVWSMWMFATDKWGSVALTVTKFVKRWLIPAVEHTGAYRLECKSMGTHVVAHKWLDSLGATRESVLERYGKNGEDFYIFRWHNRNHRNPK